MLRRMILPLIFGLVGAAVLAGLGIWQLQRLEWKEDILAEIDARMGGDPVALPTRPDPGTDAYLAVAVTGRFDAPEIRVLASTRDTGAVYRLIAPFETADGRRILIDRGLLPVDAPSADLAGQSATITGNLHWPEEIDSYTPEPDPDADIWFARDLPAMALTLRTEPVLIVARAVIGPQVIAQPFPVDTSSIPNNHLGYAVQWFGLAIVWLGMTVFLLWRIRRNAQ